MFKKLFSIICLWTFLGCEQDNSDDPNYVFSDQCTVASISAPTGQSGALALITDRANNYVVVVTDSVQLQRMKADHSGFYDIEREQYTIIAPGDNIQFAWVKDQIDYSPRPPVVRPSTIKIMK